MTETSTVRVDVGTRERLNALAELIGCPVAEVVRTLSFADMNTILQATARRGALEVKPAIAKMEYLASEVRKGGVERAAGALREFEANTEKGSAT